MKLITVLSCLVAAASAAPGILSTLSTTPGAIDQRAVPVTTLDFTNDLTVVRREPKRVKEKEELKLDEGDKRQEDEDEDGKRPPRESTVSFADNSVSEKVKYKLDKILEHMPKCMDLCFTKTYQAAGCAQKDDFLCFCRTNALFLPEVRLCMMEYCGSGNVVTSQWEENQRTICGDVIPRIVYKYIPPW
ncbi:hypothetical protein OQA88_1313 [Cercophora sp. LCS_1]